MDKFDGAPEKYLDFVVDLERFFYSQPNTYDDHITKFESIRARSSARGKDCVKEFVLSLSKDLRTSLKTASLSNASLRDNYVAIKNWLLGYESIEIQEALQDSAPVSDPMEIG